MKRLGTRVANEVTGLSIFDASCFHWNEALQKYHEDYDVGEMPSTLSSFLGLQKTK